jgi:hypothetical protein
MYDPFIFVLLISAGLCLVAGYQAKSIVKYPLLLSGAVMLIVFGMLVGSVEGIQQEIGANFHVVRDENFRVQDINMLLDYVPTNSTSNPVLFTIGNFAEFGGIIILLLILADLGLHTFRGFKQRNL